MRVEVEELGSGLTAIKKEIPHSTCSIKFKASLL